MERKNLAIQSIDDLARQITALHPSEQRALLDKVAQINLRKGLHDLSEKYRERLARQGRLDIPPEEVWAELHHIRKEIAAHEYPD
ncbi:MAG TPA: hypothetical protein VGN90_07725 [Pyrinomonadaceae bacterium]|jgi:hypothetical protein|nr:hypothetical protein [Pyrinomonadaceae bacterium]